VLTLFAIGSQKEMRCSDSMTFDELDLSQLRQHPEINASC
jgi:hypothetical protein